MQRTITNLAMKARGLGLAQNDVEAIENLARNGEFKVALEWLIDQLFEYNIKIDQNFYQETSKISREMDVGQSRLTLLESLTTNS